MTRSLPTALFLALIAALPGTAANAQDYVCAETNLGEFCMTLYPEVAPNTVANFLDYVNDGDYDGTIIHRSEFKFVLQGGGYTYTPALDDVPADPPLANEYRAGTSLSNVFGTVAMAKVSGNPDSATNQWFLNLGDNSFLDDENGGFVVFAGISHGMHVIQRMSELRRVNLANALGSAFASVPVLQDTVGIPIEFPEDFIQIQRMYATKTLPTVASFNGQTLAFPLTLGSTIYQVNMTLTAQSPEYIFRVVRGALIPLANSGQQSASSDLATGRLTIPSLQVGKREFSNVVLELTDPKALTFRLAGFDQD